MVSQRRLECKHDASRAFFQKHVPSLVAAIWSPTKNASPNEIRLSAIRILGFCLQEPDGSSQFLKTFLLKIQVSEAGLVKKMLQRGKELRQTPLDFTHIGCFLESLQTLIFTHLWIPLMLDGGVDMVLRIFSELSKESHITPGWSLSLGLCFEFFNAILVTKRGYPFLVKMFKDGFLISFFKCSPNFDKLDADKQELCKSLVSERIPNYFHLYPVLKSMSTALEKIAVSERRKLRQTFIEEYWVGLETFLLERLVCKKLYDITYKGSGSQMCIGVRLNMSYHCSLRV